jgi:hypothetical protein
MPAIFFQALNFFELSCSICSNFIAFTSPRPYYQYMEYKQADFCQTYGIARSTVSMAIKRGALQKNTAGLIDDENTLNKVFLAKHRLKATNEALADDGKNAERVIKQIDFSTPDDYEIAEHAGLPQKLLGMTIRELVVKHRGLSGLGEYIKMLRDLAAADKKDQKIRERRLQLAEKDFIIARVFQYIDTLMRQLLEWPGGAADGIIALVQSEKAAARLGVIRLMEKGIADIIKDSKAQIMKEMGGLRAKYQDEDKLDEVKAVIEEAIGD